MNGSMSSSSVDRLWYQLESASQNFVEGTCPARHPVALRFDQTWALLWTWQHFRWLNLMVSNFFLTPHLSAAVLWSNGLPKSTRDCSRWSFLFMSTSHTYPNMLTFSAVARKRTALIRRVCSSNAVSKARTDCLQVSCVVTTEGIKTPANR